MAVTTAHSTAYPTDSRAVAATGASALDGHESTCNTCGFKGSTSLSAREATKLVWAHIDYMTRQGR